MAQKKLDLAGMFQVVTETLAENQQALNSADEYNRNHGDNMVQTFQTITEALQQKKRSSSSAALAYAAKQVSKTANSSSGQAYAKNLELAAAQFKGKQVNAQGALSLLQTLVGGSQGGSGQAAGGDMLGALLGGMGGQDQSAAPAGGDMLGALLGGMGGQGQPAAPAGGDMLGALLGGAQGQGSSTGGDLLGSLLGGMSGEGGNLKDGLDLQDIMAAGMAFMQARQTGQSNAQALVQAIMAGSGMGNASHRQQSTQVVVQSFLQALGSMAGK